MAPKLVRLYAHLVPGSPWIRLNDQPEGAVHVAWLTTAAVRRLKRECVSDDIYALTVEEFKEAHDADMRPPIEGTTPAEVRPPQMTWHPGYLDGIRPKGPYGRTDVSVRGIPDRVIPFVRSRTVKVKALREQIQALPPELQQARLQVLTWMLDGVCDPHGAGAATIRAIIQNESSTKLEQQVLAGNAGVWAGEGRFRPRVAHWNWRGLNKPMNGQSQLEARQWEGVFRSRYAAIERLMPKRREVHPITGRVVQVVDEDKIRLQQHIQCLPPTSIKVRRRSLGGTERHGHYLASAPTKLLNDWLHDHLWPTAQEPIARFLSYVWMYWHAPEQQVLLPVAIKLRAYATGRHWLDLWNEYHRANPGKRGLHALDSDELGGPYFASRPHVALATYAARKARNRGVL